MTDATKTVLDEVKSVVAYDELEKAHTNDVIGWVKSTDNIFRISKPDIPPKHLVSYFVVYDKVAKKIMLVDHLKAKAWLPSGGHVESNEDPRDAVVREAQEELQLDAAFDVVGTSPFFVTVGETKPPGSHIDVSLWYVISADSTQKIQFDPREMNGCKWFSFSEIFAMEIKLLDPHMHRFTSKFRDQIVE